MESSNFISDYKRMPEKKWRALRICRQYLEAVMCLLGPRTFVAENFSE